MFPKPYLRLGAVAEAVRVSSCTDHRALSASHLNSQSCPTHSIWKVLLLSLPSVRLRTTEDFVQGLLFPSVRDHPHTHFSYQFLLLGTAGLWTVQALYNILPVPLGEGISHLALSWVDTPERGWAQHAWDVQCRLSQPAVLWHPEVECYKDVIAVSISTHLSRMV